MILFKQNKNKFGLVTVNVSSTCNFFIAIILIFISSCNDKKENINNDKNSLSDSEQNIIPIDASALELSSYDYMRWLKSNKGLTYNFFENDSLLLSVIYQPYQLQAAMGVESTGMSYEQLLNSRKGMDYFFVECLFKKVSAKKNTRRRDYLNYVKNNIYIIKNNIDTMKNITIEAFASSIASKPDNIMIMLASDSKRVDISCVIDNKALGLKNIKIEIPQKQFELFPKLKI